MEEIEHQAHQAIEAARSAAAQGDLESAGRSLEQAVELCRSAQLIQPLASALYDLGEVRLNQGRLPDALEHLNEAEHAYTFLGFDLDTRAYIADVRIRRARVFSQLGHDLLCLQDVQKAVKTYIGLVDPQRLDDSYLSLARVLALASTLLVNHASSTVALAAAQEATFRLVAVLNNVPAARGPHTSRYIDASLHVEFQMLRALGQDHDLDIPTAAATTALGAARAAEFRREPVPASRPGLAEAVRIARPSPAVTALQRRLGTPAGTTVIPGFLVHPNDLLAAGAEAHELLLALSGSDDDLALAAGRDGACLFHYAALSGAFHAEDTSKMLFADDEFAFDGSPRSSTALVGWIALLADLAALAQRRGALGLALDCGAQAHFITERLDVLGEPSATDLGRLATAQRTLARVEI